MRRQVPYELTVLDVINGKTRYDLTCLGCGGCEQELRGDLTQIPHIHCKACGGWIGGSLAIGFKAAKTARDMGLDADLQPFIAKARAATSEAVERRKVRDEN